MQYASIAPFDCALILTTTENLALVLLRELEITLSGTKLSAWAFRLRQNTFSSCFFCPLPSVSMFLLPFALFLFCTSGNQWWRRRIVFAVGDVCSTWSESTTPYLCFSISMYMYFHISLFLFFRVSMFLFFGIYFWPVWSPPTSTYVANLYYVSHGVSHCCRTRNTHSITSHLDQNPEGPLSHSFRNAGLIEQGFSPQVTVRHTLMKYYSNSFLQREKLENRYKFWIPLCITLEVRGIFVLWIDWVKSRVYWEWALMRKIANTSHLLLGN